MGDVDDADLTMPDGSPIPEGAEGDAIRAQMRAERWVLLLYELLIGPLYQRSGQVLQIQNFGFLDFFHAHLCT